MTATWCVGAGLRQHQITRGNKMRGGGNETVRRQRSPANICSVWRIERHVRMFIHTKAQSNNSRVLYTAQIVRVT